MANKKWYVVTAQNGLNVREAPSKKSAILRVLAYNERIEIDHSVDTPEGWLHVKDGGFVMRDFVK